MGDGHASQWNANIPACKPKPDMSFIHPKPSHHFNGEPFNGQFEHGQTQFCELDNSSRSRMNLPESMGPPPWPELPQQQFLSRPYPQQGQNQTQQATPFPYPSVPPPPLPHPSGSMSLGSSGPGRGGGGGGGCQGFPLPMPPPFLPPPSMQQMMKNEGISANPSPHAAMQRPPHHSRPQFPPNFRRDVPKGSVRGDSPVDQKRPHLSSNFQQNAPSCSRGFQYFSARGGHGSESFVPPRLLPYQSQRSRHQPQESENTALSSPQGSRPPFGRFGAVAQGPVSDIRLQSSEGLKQSASEPEPEENEDQKWVNNWLSGLKKTEPVIRTQRKKTPSVRIVDAKRILKRYIELLNRLKERRDQASERILAGMDDDQWVQCYAEMQQLLEELSSLQTKISDPEFADGLSTQIRRRKSKRERIRRRRREDWLAREEEIQKRHEGIDARMRDALHAKQEKKQEEALQREVDNTLSEVRRKKQEANRTMDLLRALRKLRNVRKESSDRQGYKYPRELDAHFEQNVSQLEGLMNQQKLLYIDEERTLQVMLEEEHEESREKARLKKRLRESQKAERAWEEQLEIMFGKSEELHLGHPLYMFRQFHRQAENDLQSLFNIRRQWDMFVVPEMDAAGTGIPVSWVVPSAPANHIWATALQDSPSS